MRDKPILFLDIDGVLNSTSWAIRTEQRGVWGIDPDTIPHLQRIVDETGCEIVISSTWRITHRLPDIRGALIKAGMRHPVPIVDKTPVLHSREPSGIYVAKIRGDEVQAWIDAIGFEESYVCLDDDADFHPGQPLVRTSNYEGLTAADADKCIAILRAAVTESAHRPDAD